MITIRESIEDRSEAVSGCQASSKIDSQMTVDGKG
jgi:hypothetical protein